VGVPSFLLVSPRFWFPSFPVAEVDAAKLLRRVLVKQASGECHPGPVHQDKYLDDSARGVPRRTGENARAASMPDTFSALAATWMTA